MSATLIKHIHANSIEKHKSDIKKKEKILEVFDKAEDQAESRTSIADKVSQILGTPCNRKLVRSVLDQKRSSKLNKLKKISL